jgi:hypothetical protein
MRKILLSLALVGIATAAHAAYPAHPKTVPEITGADISARVKAISDDAFEGRGPGTPNGEAAAAWIADELKALGNSRRRQFTGRPNSHRPTSPSANPIWCSWAMAWWRRNITGTIMPDWT